MGSCWPELPGSMAESYWNRMILDLLRENFNFSDLEIVFEPQADIELFSSMFDFRYGRLAVEAGQLSFHAELDHSRQASQASDLIEHLIEAHGLRGEITYISDNLLLYILKFDIRLLGRLLPHLLLIPQHHYFVNLAGKWAISISFENDFTFVAFESPLTQ